MPEPLTIECETHGTAVAAVVCGHMLQPTNRVLGFVETSSDPNDLQAWCDDCEAMFLREGSMTDDFCAFHDMKVVCQACFEIFKQRHSQP